MTDLKLLVQGAEGRVFSSVWLDRNVIVKHRFKKKYRQPQLDEHITKERIKAEAKALIRCRAIGINVPALYDVNLKSNEIIIENIEDAIQVRKFIYGKEIHSPVLAALAKEIGCILGKLHTNHIIHGDLTTSNMLIKENDLVVYLIDFGLSYVSEQAEDKAVDLYVLERAILSTHPNSEEFMEIILKTYKANGGKGANEVLVRFEDVKLRGRKKLCFG